MDRNVLKETFYLLANDFFVSEKKVGEVSGGKKGDASCVRG